MQQQCHGDMHARGLSVDDTVARAASRAAVASCIGAWLLPTTAAKYHETFARLQAHTLLV